MLKQADDHLEQRPARHRKAAEELLHVALELRLTFGDRLRRRLLGRPMVRPSDKLAAARRRAREALHDGVKRGLQPSRQDR